MEEARDGACSPSIGSAGCRVVRHDQCIFVNAPQYHWHVQGGVGADDEGQVAHCCLGTEVISFWSPDRGERTGDVAPPKQRSKLVLGWSANFLEAQEMWESEYNKFITELSTFVNKEISEFWHSVLLVGETTTLLQGTVQATSQRMDRIQNEVTSIRSDLKEQIDIEWGKKQRQS